MTLADEFDESALKVLNEFSHLEIIFYFDKEEDDKIHRSSPEAGIFAQKRKKAGLIN